MSIEHPAGMEVRRARPDDRAAAALLLSSVFPADAEARLRGMVFVAESAGAIVGVASLEQFGGEALLGAACIAEPWRGRHVGTTLVEHVLTEAALEALHSVYLGTTGAAGFFARFGFREIGVDELPDPVRRALARDDARIAEAVMMQLLLAEP